MKIGVSPQLRGGTSPITRNYASPNCVSLSEQHWVRPQLAHSSAGFAASGEPKSGSVEPLSARDGPLHIQAMRNGPLQLRGNLEICAGTGRTVARVTEAKLCRCGQSKNKPFCDLSHIAAGFNAEGA